MENLYIKGSHDVYFKPTVDFNAESGVCELIGESYLEETVKFYQPVLEWLEKYVNTVRKPLVFNFKLDYYNTTSSRSILDILDIIKLYEDDGGIVTVNWYCKAEEIQYIEEEVDDYRIQTDIDIQLIPYD